MSLSKNNLKLITSLQQKKYRQKHQLFVAEGIKVVNELLNSSIDASHVFSTDASFIVSKDVDLTIISDNELKKISTLKNPNTVLGIFKIPTEKEINNTSFTIALDAVNDPGNLGTIIRSAEWFGLNEIYCSSRCVTQEDISKLLAFSFEYGVNVHVVSDNSATEEGEESFEAMALEYSELDLENYPLIDQKNLIIKRCFDLLFSTIVIITVLSWVTLILGILIKLESKGPVFFIQPRAGRNGKYFMCLKFRSMRQNAGVKQATKDDPRITKIGRIIRKLSIDELPQFINVFRGQMSVVGPRPHIKDLNDKYDSTISNYNDRILVKPGITGLSQITGHRGETNGNASMANRIRIDILYLRSWTLYLDLVIIYKTVVDVLFFKSKNAY